MSMIRLPVARLARIKVWPIPSVFTRNRHILLSLCYSIFLTGISNNDFMDRENYLNYTIDAARIYERFSSDGVIAIIANEPLWLAINFILSIFFNSEESIAIIIFISSFCVSFFALRRINNKIVLVVFILFLPQIIKNHIIHLRQGMGIAVFLLGYGINGGRANTVRYISPLIHASLFFIIIIDLINKIAEKTKSTSLQKTIIVSLPCLFMSLFLGAGAMLVGARQAGEYNLASVEGSGAGFILWSIILMILLNNNKRNGPNERLSIGFIVFYLSSYYINAVSARIFESSLLLVVLCIFMLRGYRGHLCITLLALQAIFFYATRINQPLLGFAA